MQHDIVVVGAGVSGLVTADRLTTQGYDVVVLEARDRVGGRTHTVPVPDHPEYRIDVGGQWVGPDQRALLAELDRFGLTTHDQDDGRDALVSLRGSLRRYRGDTPKIGAVALADVGQALWRFDRLCARVDLDAPWATPDAVRLDAQTFETWIRRNLRTSQGRDFFRIGCEAVFATTSANLSLLHALFYSRSGTSFSHLLTTGGGAQHAVVDGGMAQLAEHLAAGLGDRVRLSSPVTAVEHGPGGVVVRTGADVVRARRTVVTVPPALVAGIAFAPPLPPVRDAVQRRMPHGSVIKCHAVYPTPFWREDGLSGEAAGDTGPVKVVFDATPPARSGAGPDDASPPGILVAFIEGADALEAAAWTLEQRKNAVVRVLAGYVGDRALSPTSFNEQDWTAEEWTRGCYGAHLPPGAWTQVGRALREPVGVVHWAGTETATRWCGYIDGAISSGERAAREVAALLPEA
ncbi:monoamine oxidase [Paraoerskovia marina]|uniref:Monoamine oxidase n=1 Tax=Paraoerskovia marina TaxID=545619 RepID=A0A1H1NEW5_9CELL|nr:FAD-dependent oxidoreductase [Paraoerskovia marina]SDR97330.1 monoamine oxidase [Paraoerskovia marina]